MLTEPLKRTALFDLHLSQKGKMVPFAGWEMPVQYEGILSEARSVRSQAGVFDVSHMGRLYISGPQAPNLLDRLLPAPASDLKIGRARYAVLCNEQGGIIDDTVFYRLSEERYLLVCNAGNRPQVVPWIRQWADDYPNTLVEDTTEDTAMLALQGPDAPRIADILCPDHPSGLRFFGFIKSSIRGKETLIARTGYTGEEGFELILSAADAPEVWQAMVDMGVHPCGLGARDVLRLEAGLMLHGNDIDSSTTPLEAGLERFVNLDDREFIGAQVLRRQRETGVERCLVGLLPNSRNIARHGFPIRAMGKVIGVVTSGTYSPTLDRSIALGYVSVQHSEEGSVVEVEVREKVLETEVTKLPFYQRRESP